MTNTYAPTSVVPTVSTEALSRLRAQQVFLETHHHLINPRFYTVEQISTKDTLLLRHRWREYDRTHVLMSEVGDPTTWST